MRLSVVFEEECEGQDEDEGDGQAPSKAEDHEDAAKEFPFDDDEAEFISIELAQEAIEEVMKALNRMSDDSRKSLQIMENNEVAQEEAGVIVGSLDVNPYLSGRSSLNSNTPNHDDKVEESKDEDSTLAGNLEVETSKHPGEKSGGEVDNDNPLETISSILEIVQASTDDTVRERVPGMLKKIQAAYIELQDTHVSATAKPLSVTAAPAPPPLPPPIPPPPPPAPTTPSKLSGFKLATKGKSVITGINLNKNEDGQVENVELRVKGKRPGGADMMSQLQTMLRKRQNRTSLQEKYQQLGDK